MPNNLLKTLGKVLIIFLGIIFPLFGLMFCGSDFDTNKVCKYTLFSNSHDIGITLLFTFGITAGVGFILYVLVLYKLLTKNSGIYKEVDIVPPIESAMYIIYLITITGGFYQYFATIFTGAIFIAFNYIEVSKWISDIKKKVGKNNKSGD